jgi:signal transduction histidine kinase
VTDDGRGIAIELQARLFTPFDRLGAEYTPVTGAGLGLAASKAFVEAMNGSIEVRSAAGRGSTFTVSLAAAEAPAAHAGKPVRAAAAA